MNWRSRSLVFEVKAKATTLCRRTVLHLSLQIDRPIACIAYTVHRLLSVDLVYSNAVKSQTIAFSIRAVNNYLRQKFSQLVEISFIHLFSDMACT